MGDPTRTRTREIVVVFFFECN